MLKTSSQMSAQTLDLIDKAYYHKKGTTYTAREKVCLILIALFISGPLVAIAIFVAVMELREWKIKGKIKEGGKHGNGN